MKKVCLILLAALLIGLTAFAAAETKPGEEVTVSLTLTNTKAAYVRVLAEYDVDVFELVGYSSDIGTAGKEGIVLVDTKPLASGVIGSVTLKVKEDAASGEYAVGGWAEECYDLDEQDCEATVDGGTVTVAAEEEPTEEKAAYTVTDIAYKRPLATGKVEHVKDTPELPVVYARVTFFCASGDCMSLIKKVEPDGSFKAGGVGNFVHISVVVLDVDDAYSAMDAIEHAHGNGGKKLK